MKKVRILYVLLSFTLFLFLVITAFGIKNISHDSVKISAVDDRYTITVNKISAFTIYVSGSGVEKVSSTTANDVFRVEQGTEVTLRVVNETRIFTNWQITGTYTTPPTYTAIGVGETDPSTCVIVPQSDLTVAVERRDPTVSDKGKYMANRFLISSYQDLYALQEAFVAADDAADSAYTTTLFVKDGADYSLIDFYDFMFEGNPTWMAYTSNSDKINGIKNVGFFETLQYGYYLVSQSFAYFDISESITISGIGTYAHPFRGVVDGLNANDISSVFIVTSMNQSTTNNSKNYVGLFGYLDEEAIIRNLTLDISIAIVKSDSNQKNQTYYIGGLAGYNNSAFIYNVECSTRQSIEYNGWASNGNVNTLYVGGLFGYMTGGIDEYANIRIKETNYSWNIETFTTFDKVYAGLVAGFAENAYVNRVNLSVGGFDLNLHSNKVATATAVQGEYSIGNIFGIYKASGANLGTGNSNSKETHNTHYRKLYLKNITLTGSNLEIVSIIVHTGVAYSGGLIGYIDASSTYTNPESTTVPKYLYIGDISYAISGSSQSSILASSLNKDSIANLYAAGLFAYINGDYVTTTSDFKNRIVEQNIEGYSFYRYNYLFDTDLSIKAENFGKTSTTYGKTIAAGLVAFGYFDISGTADSHTKLLLSSKDHLLTVDAIQKTSATTPTKAHNFDHCFAGLLFGTVNTSETTNRNLTYQYIDVYADQFGAETTREIDSTAVGDLKVAGFMAFANGITLDHITMHLNNGYINCSSLSYASTIDNIANGNTDQFNLTKNGNNASCGSIVASLWSSTVSNCKTTGFDDSYNETGTKLRMLSIQNAQTPNRSDNNYRAENYIGGLFGMFKKTIISDCTYNGSTSNDDYIQLQGHQNPDTAFCGGIVGYICNLKESEANSGSNNRVINCIINNAHVYAGATNTNTGYNKPDIYIGGIVGASLCNQTSTTTISGCRVNNSKVEAVANEIMRAYCGGIVGTIGWQDIYGYVHDCYVYNSSVIATSKGKETNNTTSGNGRNWARAAGIQANTVGNRGTTTISNCVVIDSTVDATASCISAWAAGIVTRENSQKATVINCYSNAYVSANGTAPEKFVYPISPEACETGNGSYAISPTENVTAYKESYYVTNHISNVTSTNGAIGITFKKVALTTTNLDIFDVLKANPSDTIRATHKYPTKFYAEFDNPTIFDINDVNNTTPVTLNQNGDTNTSNYLYILINPHAAGITTRPIFDEVNYSTLEDLMEDGWFIFGTLIVYNGISDQVGTLSNPSITYPIGIREYEYIEARNVYRNKMYPYDEIQNNDYENIGYVEEPSDGDASLPVPVGVSSYVSYDLSNSISTFPAQTTTSAGNYFYFKTTSNEYYYSFLQRDTNNWYDFELVGSAIEGGVTYYYYRIPRPVFENVTSNQHDQAKIYRFTSTAQQAQHSWQSNFGSFLVNINQSDNTSLYLFETNVNGATSKDFSGPSTYINVTTNNIVSNSLGTTHINVVGDNLLNGSSHNLDVYYSIDGHNWSLVSNSNLTYTNTTIDINMSGYSTWLVSDTKYIQFINTSATHDSTIYSIDVTYDLATKGVVNSNVFNISTSTGSTFNVFDEGTETISPLTSNGYLLNADNFELLGTSGEVEVKRVITVNARENIPDVLISFSIENTSTAYYEQFVDIEGNPVSFDSEWGTYSFTSTVLSELDATEYEFRFKPNPDIEQISNFYLAFKIGSTDNYASYCYRFIINPNRRILERVVYASYTPPLNYQQTSHLGEASNPYMLAYASTTKLLPVFTRLNDLPTSIEEYHFASSIALTQGAVGYTKYYELINGEYVLTEDTVSDTSKTYYVFMRPEYLTETGTALVTYNLNTPSTGTMNASGEFITKSSGNFPEVYYITITLDEDPLQSKAVYYVFSNKYTVSYASEGADIAGLANTTNRTPYISDMTIQSGYCGMIDTFVIKIGDEPSSVTYVLEDIITNGWLKDERNNPYDFDDNPIDLNYRFYRLEIPGDVINGNININVVFKQMFTITFDLCCSDFATDYTGPQTLTYSVIKGTSFHDFFVVEESGARLDEINDIRDDVIDTLSGCIHSGWYLIDNANNVISYTTSFEDIIESSILVNSSFVFYARWSFLIELVEAPGTHITTAFNSDFMYHYDENGVVTNSILIPLNNNNGYIFTVNVDNSFIGDVTVNAYIARKVNGEFVVQEIEIEAYNNNSDIYHIRKENINGYVIIATSVSNSHIIVGRNTASLMDEIVPQDGVFTFKYVVNHYNIDSDTKSYIFTNNNLNKKMDLMLDFYVHKYNDLSNVLELEPYNLPQDTVIEVYYSRYSEDVETPYFTAVGTYKCADSNKSTFHLSEFSEWNYHEDFLDDSDCTFSEMIGARTTLSEVYYIVVTPPNGYDILPDVERMTQRDVWNHILNVGYVEEDDDPENTLGYKYLEGERKQGNYNIIDLNQEYSDALQTTVSDETSLQTAYYSVVPSRKTEVSEMKQGTFDGAVRDYFTFYNVDDYAFMNLTYKNCYINSDLDYVIMYDDGTHGRSQITSSAFAGHYLQIALTLGYNTGNVKIEGRFGDGEWVEVETIYVDDIEYKEYTIYFPQDYDQFRITNMSLNTIFLKEIDYVSRLTSIEYELKVSDYFDGDYNKQDFVSSTGTLGTLGYEATYRTYQNIQGDFRHEGKTFVLAVQLRDTTSHEIVMQVPVYNVTCHIHYTYRDSNNVQQEVTRSVRSMRVGIPGKNTIFFNFTEILRDISNEADFKVDHFDFYFTIMNTNVEINSIMLYESTSFHKPSISETRQVVYTASDNPANNYTALSSYEDARVAYKQLFDLDLPDYQGASHTWHSLADGSDVDFSASRSDFTEATYDAVEAALITKLGAYTSKTTTNGVIEAVWVMTDYTYDLKWFPDSLTIDLDVHTS